MRIFLLFTLCLVICFITPTHGSTADTQVTMTSDACGELEQAENQMKGLYRLVLREHRDDRRFIAAFKKAQKAWRVYRNAQLKAVYPEAPECYGTAYAMCRCVVLKDLTRDRVRYLQKWVSDETEGDVCAGSTKR